MSKVLIIGAGGVGGVVTHKCAQAPDVFSEITLASRTLEKCERIRDQIDRPIEVAQLDADNKDEVIALVNRVKPDAIINVALPYQNLSIMDACMETGVDYLDTANYEPPEAVTFSYTWQWPYERPFREKGIMGLLGCGFDPGVTNIFCAYGLKHYFDEIHTIDILDCNAGDHGQFFATNFNPEINIREVTLRAKWYENGAWQEGPPMTTRWDFDFPEVGSHPTYLMYHEEMECLARNIPGVKTIRFWMHFSDTYINTINVLQKVGMTRIDPVYYEGHPVIPIRFLKEVLPEPASLAEGYEGKTCIGCLLKGIKDGRPRRIFIYNICSHQKAYEDAKSQAVSYTTGVPAMIGAKLMAQNVWRREGVVHPEELDPDPFMEDLNTYGLPWHVEER